MSGYARDFYPRSPCGERQPTTTGNDKNNIFLSTLSLRRATRRHRGNHRSPIHFYPRSPCGERLTEFCLTLAGHRISIHALLAESDQSKALKVAAHGISIHALLAESDRVTSSTRSQPSISIHALLAESDFGLQNRKKRHNNFYPRSPCGERLRLYRLPLIALPISIHALLAESDTWTRGSRITYVEFLSTLSLRRATIGTLRTVSVKKTFLSTLSLRRATEKENQH